MQERRKWIVTVKQMGFVDETELQNFIAKKIDRILILFAPQGHLISPSTI